MDLEACLPAELQRSTTTITRMAGGLSGATVYRVDADTRVFVLKVAGDGESAAEWAATLQLQRLAAEVGLAPRIVHADEQRRAVVTDFVPDRSFFGFYRDPGTHEAAVALLGQMVERIQALPVPAGAQPRDPGALLAQLFGGLQRGFAVPDFAAAAIRRVLAETPTADGDLVLGHNDLNPTNLVYDGTAILLLDWAAAGPIDASYDLATLAVFLRMDEADCLRLLAAYQGGPTARLPDRFLSSRRLVATLAGAMQLHLARQMKHAGASGETLATTPSLGDFYQKLRAGTFQMGTAAGQWAFGLALLQESLAL
jgi:hypothetical protein